MSPNTDYYRAEFINHEMLNKHRAIEDELSFYIAIANGDEEYVVDKCSHDFFLSPKGKGVLSDNPLMNMRYHFVVTAAMITRYCIFNGMEQEKAYSLSDYYIQKMDNCSSIDQISDLHNTMAVDYCKRMQILRNKKPLSKPVILTQDYIYSHIHERITMKALASEIGFSSSYLSKTFHQEIGIPISEYILNLKIEKAENLLRYSDTSITDISCYLAFSSQSHFIQVFKAKMGITPTRYRQKYFRQNWENHSFLS